MKLSKSIIIVFAALIALTVLAGAGLLIFYPKETPKTPVASTPADPSALPNATPGAEAVPDQFDPVEWGRDPQATTTPLPAPTATTTGTQEFTVTMPAEPAPAPTTTLPSSPGASFPGDAAPVKTPVVKTTPVADTPAVVEKTPAPAAPKAAAKPVVKSTPKASPAAAKPAARVTQYWIQVGSFKDRFQAENTAKSLEAQGLKGTLSTATVNGQAVVRVRVGPYSNEAEAGKFLAWLTPVKEFSGSYITRVGATRPR